MKLLGIFAGIGTNIIKIIAGVIAVSMIAYGGYAVWDDMHAERSAYSTSEIKQYRPEEANEESFEDIVEINEDTTGWLILYNTNIDYPVMQGKDDLEYANKDVYGNAKPSGSIYLATEMKSDYTDDYNIVFGHHMDNGAMFGDLDKYWDIDFLKSHKKGALITPEQIYDVEILVCTAVSAYDNIIYDYDKQQSEFTALADYILSQKHTGSVGAIPESQKLLVLSTCSDYTTNGRTVVIGKLTPNTTSLEEIEEDGVPLGKLFGHKANNWALLNLICMVFTIYICLPIARWRIKFKRGPKMQEVNDGIYDLLKEMDDNEDHEVNNDGEDREEREEDEEQLYHTKKFKISFRIGLIIEIIISVAAVIAFILTENIRYPMIFCDEWTWLMVLLLALCWIIDVVLMRYLKRKDSDKDEENDKEGEEKCTDI